VEDLFDARSEASLKSFESYRAQRAVVKKASYGMSSAPA